MLFCQYKHAIEAFLGQKEHYKLQQKDNLNDKMKY